VRPSARAVRQGRGVSPFHGSSSAVPAAPFQRSSGTVPAAIPLAPFQRSSGTVPARSSGTVPILWHRSGGFHSRDPLAPFQRDPLAPFRRRSSGTVPAGSIPGILWHRSGGDPLAPFQRTVPAAILWHRSSVPALAFQRRSSGTFQRAARSSAILWHVPARSSGTFQRCATSSSVGAGKGSGTPAGTSARPLIEPAVNNSIARRTSDARRGSSRGCRPLPTFRPELDHPDFRRRPS
jgi:hypothetical protein